MMSCRRFRCMEGFCWTSKRTSEVELALLGDGMSGDKGRPLRWAVIRSSRRCRWGRTGEQRRAWVKRPEVGAVVCSGQAALG